MARLFLRGPAFNALLTDRQLWGPLWRAPATAKRCADADDTVFWRRLPLHGPSDQPVFAGTLARAARRCALRLTLSRGCSTLIASTCSCAPPADALAASLARSRIVDFYGSRHGIFDACLRTGSMVFRVFLRVARRSSTSPYMPFGALPAAKQRSRAVRTRVRVGRSFQAFRISRPCAHARSRARRDAARRGPQGGVRACRHAERCQSGT